MKKILLALLIAVSLLACRKEHITSYEGVITGPDYRECASPYCGGWYIRIDNVTYRFLDIPDGSEVNLNDPSYPIYVNLEWEKDSGSPADDLIIIKSISLAE